MNFDCLDLCKAYNYFVLPMSNSDHHPLLLSMSDDDAITRHSFRFFSDVATTWWLATLS